MDRKARQAQSERLAELGEAFGKPVFQIPVDGPNGEGVVLVPAQVVVDPDGKIRIIRRDADVPRADRQVGEFADLPTEPRR